MKIDNNSPTRQAFERLNKKMMSLDLTEKDYDDLQLLQTSINTLYTILTPPTADEVCRAIEADYKDGIIVKYREKDHQFKVVNTIVAQYYGEADIKWKLKPNTLLLLARFYKGVMKNE